MKKNEPLYFGTRLVLIALLSAFFVTLTLLVYILLTLLILKIVPEHFFISNPWFIPVVQAVLLILIIVISRMVLKSSLKENIKASYWTVPIIYSMIYINSVIQLPILKALLIGLSSVFIVSYLILTQKNWLYYFTSIIAALILFILSI